MQQKNVASKPRRHEISFLNVLLCMVVIFIHINSYAVSGFTVGTVKYNIAMYLWRLSSFAVQGFILLSGVKFFLTKKDEVPYGKYLLSRLKVIAGPYVSIFIVYYAVYFIVYDYPLNAGFIFKQFYTGSLACHLYFIPLILQFDLLSPLWKKLVNKVSGIIIVPFCLLLGQILNVFLSDMIKMAFPDFSFIYSDRIFTSYLIYWIAGCYIGKNYDAFLKILKENFVAIVSVLGITLVVFCYYTYMAFNNIASVPSMNQIHSFYVISMLCFLYAFALKFGAAVMNKVKLLSKIDRASFSIYLWHMLVLISVNVVIDYFGLVAQGIAFAIRMVLVYTITITWCVMLTKFRTKSKKIKSDTLRIPKDEILQNAEKELSSVEK